MVRTSLYRANFSIPLSSIKTHPTHKAHVEEIIERISAKPSVDSYVICDAKQGGPIYRRAQRTTEERAGTMAEALRPIAAKARGVVRDLDPAVRALCLHAVIYNWTD